MARKYYILKEDNGLGCCNLIIWDFFSVILVAIFGLADLFPNLHIVFRILIGLVSATIIIVLMNIKYLGIVVQTACGLFWTYFILSALDALFEISTKLVDDPISLWAIRSVLAFILIGLHFASNMEMKEDIKPNPYRGNRDDSERLYNDNFGNSNSSNINTNFNTNTSTKFNTFEGNIKNSYENFMRRFEEESNYNNQFMQQGTDLINQGINNNEFISTLNKNKEIWDNAYLQIQKYSELLGVKSSELECRGIFSDLELLLKQLQIASEEVRLRVNEIINSKSQYQDQYQYQTSSTGMKFDPFAGCNDKESLNKRYRSLAKNFHPDIENGDLESLQYLNNEYERLLKKFQ